MHSIGSAATGRNKLFVSGNALEAPTELRVIGGQMPEWLAGCLFRNGPGRWEIGDGKLNHLFDGYSLLHRIKIDCGRVWYSSRFLGSDSYNAAVAAGRPLNREFGTDPSATIWSRLTSLVAGTSASDNANVHVFPVLDHLVAMTESPFGHLVHPVTLARLGPWSSAPVAQPMAGQVACMTTAHCLTHPITGAAISFATRFTVAPTWPLLQCYYDINIINDIDAAQSVTATDGKPGASRGEVGDGELDVVVTRTAVRARAPRQQAQPTAAVAAGAEASALNPEANIKPDTWSTSSSVSAFDAAVTAGTVTHRIPMIEGGCGHGMPAYQHSFAITADYAVMTECPMLFNTLSMVKTMLSGSNITDMFEWSPQTSTVHFRVVHLGTGQQVARIPIPATSDTFFTLHHVNAYQTKRVARGERGCSHDGVDADGTAAPLPTITVDVCAYKDPSVIDDFRLDRLRAGRYTEASSRSGANASALRRFVLDLDDGTCAEVPLVMELEGSDGQQRLGRDFFFELPSVHLSRVGLQHRYAYAVRAQPDTYIDGLVKMDMNTLTCRVWAEEGCAPSEPIFVPRPGGVDEDDGVVLSLVLDGSTGRATSGASYVLALDAATFAEISRAPLPGGRHAPMTFHGSWLDSTRLDAMMQAANEWQWRP